MIPLTPATRPLHRSSIDAAMPIRIPPVREDSGVKLLIRPLRPRAGHGTC